VFDDPNDIIFFIKNVVYNIVAWMLEFKNSIEMMCLVTLTRLIFFIKNVVYNMNSYFMV
jgi:hypothetical protein